MCQRTGFCARSPDAPAPRRQTSDASPVPSPTFRSKMVRTIASGVTAEDLQSLDEELGKDCVKAAVRAREREHEKVREKL